MFIRDLVTCYDFPTTAFLMGKENLPFLKRMMLDEIGTTENSYA